MTDHLLRKTDPVLVFFKHYHANLTCPRCSLRKLFRQGSQGSLQAEQPAPASCSLRNCPWLLPLKLVVSPLWSHLPDPLDHSYIYGGVFSTRLWVGFQKHRMLFMHKLIDIVVVPSGWVVATYLVSGEGNGNSLQYSCLENPMDRGAWQAPLSMGSQESDTT